MPIKATVGGDDVSEYLRALDATPSGPGVVGSARLYIDKALGGLDLRYGEEVKVWRTFDDAGNGVAAKGRLFGGIVANRTTGHKHTTKLWEIDCQSYNILLARIVRDAQGAKTITLTAGTFAAQVAQLTQIIQTNGFGAVAQSIDATSKVASLVASMPGATYEAGYSYGWYLMRLCEKAREINPALRPAFFIDVVDSFGVGDVFGSATLNVYDAAVPASPIYTYHTDPTGAQKQIWGEFKRRLEGAEVINRRQLVFGDGLVVEYASATSGTTYPNVFINHGLTGNKGYWMTEPLGEDDITSWSSGQAIVRADVERTAYPRETVEFDIQEHLQPGDTIHVINDLESLDHDMRIVEAKWDWSSDMVSPWMHIRLGARILRLGEDGEPTLALPAEGDTTPPAVPTWAGGGGWILQNIVATDWSATVEVQTTLTEPGDMSHYIWRYTLAGGEYQYARTEAGDKTLLLEGLPFATDMTFEVEAFDTSANGSGYSAVATLTTASLVPPAPNNFERDTSYNGGVGYNYTDGFGVIRTIWLVASPQPDYYDIQAYPTARPDEVETFSVDGSVTALEIPRLHVAQEYTFRIRSVEGVTPGPWSSFTYTVPRLAAPTGVNVIDIWQEVNSETLLAMIGWTLPTGFTLTQIELYWYRWTGSFTPDARGRTIFLPPQSTQGEIDGLTPTYQYAVQVRAWTGGTYGTWANHGPFTATVVPGPTDGSPNFEQGQHDNDTAGFHVTNTTGTVLWDLHRPASPKKGKTVLRAQVSASSEGYVLGPAYAVTEGVSFVQGFYAWRESGDAAGPGKIEGVWYDAADAVVGSAGVIKPLAAFAGSATLYEVKLTPPSSVNVSYWRPKITVGNGATGAFTVYFATPAHRSEVKGLDLAPVMDITAQLHIYYGAGNRMVFYEQDIQEFAGIGTGGTTAGGDATLTIAATDGKVAITASQALRIGAQHGVDLLDLVAAPGTPASSYLRLYHKGDKLYYKDDGGTEREVAVLGTVMDEAVDDRVSALISATSPIVETYNDAAGTLVVSHANSGVSAATYDFATVTADATGHVTAAVDNAGTSFPGSPTSGQCFIRTDLGLLCRYDGTRWLGPEFPFPMSYRASEFQPHTADLDIIWQAFIPTGKTYYATRWTISTYIPTTLNGSNYWVVRLLKASDASTITSSSTSAQSPDVWTEHTTITSFTGNPFTRASIGGFAIQIDKTGSPGSLYLETTLYLREVVV